MGVEESHETALHLENTESGQRPDTHTTLPGSVHFTLTPGSSPAQASPSLIEGEEIFACVRACRGAQPLCVSLSPPRMGNKGVEESHTRSYTRWPVSTVLKSEPRSLIWTPRPVMWRNRDPG